MSWLNFLDISKEIAFKFDEAMEAATRADFTYKITPNTITITNTTLGKLSVTKDIDVVLRKVEYEGKDVRLISRNNRATCVR